MFLTELKFATGCLMRGFVKKLKSIYLETDLQTKKSYESKNLSDWNKGRCVICTFLVCVDAKGFNSSTIKKSYYNFIIQNEHKFLRNIYNSDYYYCFFYSQKKLGFAKSY